MNDGAVSFRSFDNQFASFATFQYLGRTILGGMLHLQWLDVSHNRLEEIDFDTFKSVQHLQVFMAIEYVLRGNSSRTLIFLQFSHSVDSSPFHISFPFISGLSSIFQKRQKSARLFVNRIIFQLFHFQIISFFLIFPKIII